MKKNSKPSILIVDDKPANILSLENLLASGDRFLLTAISGKDALQTVLNNNIDLIILDVQMPEMNGFEVAQILKSNKRTRDIPIIFTTAENKDHKFVMQGYDEGAIDYLFKPLDPDIVRAKVAVLLKIQLQKKELLEKNSLLQKSALLINNSADIIGIIDASTFVIEEINDAFFHLLGYDRQEVKQTPLAYFLPKEELLHIQELKRVANDRLSFEGRIYAKDRSIKWLQWKVAAKKGKWYVNARDITGFREVEKIRNYLATVVKQSNDAVYIHDHEGKIISWNDGAEKIYGYTEDEATRMKVWNIIPDYMQTESGEMVHQVIYGKKIQDMATKRMTKHGKLIDVLFSAEVLHEGDDGHSTIAITERDITRQKIAEDRLRENEQFLTSILNTMGESVVVSDAEGNILLVNSSAEKILGKEISTIRVADWGAECGLYGPGGKKICLPENLPIVRAINCGESIQEEMFVRNRHVPHGINVIATSNPLKDVNGHVIGCVCVMLDISGRKKAEEALQESEKRFRNLFEFAPFPMWVYDLETLAFLEVNEPAIRHYGYSREEFLQMKIADIRPPEDVPRLVEDVRKTRNILETSSEWRHRLRSGEEVDVEITSHLIDFWGRKASLVVAKDITEQKKTEQYIRELNDHLVMSMRQLEVTNKELESFSYSVSHDLRAPLRGLNGYASMLEEDYGHLLDDEGKRLLGNIQNNTQKMGTLIDDLLAFSRMGRKEVQKYPVNVDHLVREIIRDLSTTTDHHAIINVEQLPPVQADPALLQQVWINLISNAIKYSGKKDQPLIHIGAEDSGTEIKYFVKDNGTGFDMKYADKLFGVFQRLHHASDFEGTGIGLAIVQRIITKHGGTVSVEAQPGEGATFYFTLPATTIQ